MKSSKQKRPVEAEDLYKIVYLEDPRISPDGQWIAFVQVTVSKLENTYKRNIWLAPTDGRKPLQLTRGGKDSQPRWSPDGKYLAFTSVRDLKQKKSSDKPQIYLLPIQYPGGDARQLTQMEYGAGNPWWSPDGSRLAFTAGLNTEERRTEGEEPEEAPKDLLEARHRKERREEAEKKRWDPRWVERIPYREGTAFLDDRYQQLYVVEVAEGLTDEEAKPRRLTDLDEHYGPPSWTPDGKYLLTLRTRRPGVDQPMRERSLFRLSVEDGSEEQITGNEFSEGGPTPTPPLASPDGQWIAYQRSPGRSPYSHPTRLTVIPASGGEARDLSLEFDRSVNDFRWSPDSRWLYMTLNDRGRIEIYRVSPEGGDVEKIIPGTMDAEQFDVAPDMGIAFVAETPSSPPELFWQPGGADEPMQLTQVNKPLLDEVIVQPTHEMIVKAPDGQEIQAWYVLPVEYEEGKTYPLAFNIHGGPHAMWSPSTKSMWHEWQFHAARGYVALFSNPRGSDGYGHAFMDAIHHQWGEPAMTDLMAVVNALLDKGFVDESRMAVTGGSYGGYMTAWIVGHTDRFSCALTARGVYNLLSFYGTSDIPSLISDEFDVEPWEDPDKLWKWSPVAYAHQIKTPLLIKHGDNDYRVPIEQAEQLFAIARRSGAPVKFIRYPRDGHELSRSGEPEHRLHRLNLMIDWFDKYCMPATD